MNCPHCAHESTQVVETRNDESGTVTRRRRECPSCGDRFTTYERVETPAVTVVKRDGSTEGFDPEKIRAGIAAACKKRPVDDAEIDAVVDAVTAAVRERGDGEVESATVGDLVIERLKKIDEVAYLRFASIYNAFDDVSAFADEVETLNTAESGGTDSAE